MIFDVMVREGFNEKGKMVINVYRYHDTILSKCIRNIQESGAYVYAVIPLFRNKYTQEKNKQVSNNELVHFEMSHIQDEIND